MCGTDHPASLPSSLTAPPKCVTPSALRRSLPLFGLMSKYADVPHGFSGRDARMDRRALRDRSNPDTGSARFYIVSIPKEPPVQIAAGAVKPFAAQRLPPGGFSNTFAPKMFAPSVSCRVQANAQRTPGSPPLNCQLPTLNSRRSFPVFPRQGN